jgi:hypothetical protein
MVSSLLTFIGVSNAACGVPLYLLIRFTLYDICGVVVNSDIPVTYAISKVLPNVVLAVPVKAIVLPIAGR